LENCALKRVSFAAAHLKVSARQSGIFLLCVAAKKPALVQFAVCNVDQLYAFRLVKPGLHA